MNRIDRAKEFRAQIESVSTYIPDEEAEAFVTLFPAWVPNGAACKAGDRRQHGGELYRCLLDHTSQAGWAPGVAPSLWVRIDDPAEEWPAWKQPGSTNPYPLGAKVTHKDKRWISTNAANVWEPGVFGWEVAK